MGRDCKWQLLVKLEVQEKGDGMKPFSMDEIQWNPFYSDEEVLIEGHETISLHRLDAFIAGESKQDDTECSFVRVTHRGNNHANYKEGNAQLYSR